jgi:hypothetical protein
VQTSYLIHKDKLTSSDYFKLKHKRTLPLQYLPCDAKNMVVIIYLLNCSHERNRTPLPFTSAYLNTSMKTIKANEGHLAKLPTVYEDCSKINVL